MKEFTERRGREIEGRGGSIDSEEENEAGPQLYDPRSDSNLHLRKQIQRVLPLGFTGMEPQLEEEIERQRNELNGLENLSSNVERDRTAVEITGQDDQVNEREEWILSPGDSKLISGL